MSNTHGMVCPLTNIHRRVVKIFIEFCVNLNVRKKFLRKVYKIFVVSIALKIRREF